MIERELLDFIQASLRSVWQVELLLWLRRSADRAWTEKELVGALRASASIVTDGLRALEIAGLVSVERGGACRYAPASDRYARLAQALDELYRERPTAVARAIFSHGDDKLRTFADAFRLRKD